MTIPAVTKNAMLDGVVFTHASLHSAFPGSTGANEISGGSYARQAITLAAASGGQRALSVPVVFSVPASTVRWIGYWSGSTFLIATPNGGAAPKNYMAAPSTELIHAVAHNFLDGQKIAFFNGTPPGGFVEGSVYYVRDTSVDSFKVAATLGGTALDITAAGSFGSVLSAITEEVYAAPGTHQLTAATFMVPD